MRALRKMLVASSLAYAGPPENTGGAGTAATLEMPVDVTLAFKLNVNLTRGDVVTLHLPGFTWDSRGRHSHWLSTHGLQGAKDTVVPLDLRQPRVSLIASEQNYGRSFTFDDYAIGNASAFNATWDTARDALKLRVVALSIGARSEVRVVVNASSGLTLPSTHSLVRDSPNLTLAVAFEPTAASGELRPFRAVPATAVEAFVTSSVPMAWTT